MMAGIVRRLIGDRVGATALEFGMVALPLTTLIFGVVEVGMVIRAKASLTYAATSAARCASINALTCGTADKLKSYAVTQTHGLDIETSAFTLSTDTCGKKVTATMPLSVNLHSVLPTGLSLTVAACYPAQPSCNVGDLVTPDGLPGVCRE
jgi:Flp pilus assembly protein TadG